MTYPIVSAAPRTAKRMFVVLASAATLVTAAATGALAQAQPPAQQRPAAPAAPRQATPPRPAQPAPAQQQRPAQAAPAAPQQQAGNGGEAPQLIFSPWVKLCNKDADPKAKRVCVTVKDGRVESG